MPGEQPQRPTTEDRDAWKAYWIAQGMPWRTEPEIDEARQRFLAERRAVKPDIERGIYPFRGENDSVKVTRADIEWLLATHESGGMRGPVDWSDEKQRQRAGLDLRGSTLCGISLTHLPLARTRFGLDYDEWNRVKGDEASHAREWAAAHLKRVDMREAHLERASFRGAHLEAAQFVSAHLQHANFDGAHLNKAIFRDAHLESAYLNDAYLAGADLRLAFLDASTQLRSAVLVTDTCSAPWVANVRWGGVNLSVVKWTQQGAEKRRKRREAIILGDEWEAREAKDENGKAKGAEDRLADFEAAVRANRQLATALRDQGLNVDADRFAYRAQVLQRQMLWRQGQWLSWLGSLLLDLIAGYGYRPLQSFIAYAVVVAGFMGLYLLNSQFVAPHLSWNEALVLSISSFHGRGFFNPSIGLGDTYAELAAAEAFIGLMVEITFIATFTQRFFAR